MKKISEYDTIVPKKRPKSVIFTFFYRKTQVISIFAVLILFFWVNNKSKSPNSLLLSCFPKKINKKDPIVCENMVKNCQEQVFSDKLSDKTNLSSFFTDITTLSSKIDYYEAPQSYFFRSEISSMVYNGKKHRKKKKCMFIMSIWQTKRILFA